MKRLILWAAAGVFVDLPRRRRGRPLRAGRPRDPVAADRPAGAGFRAGAGAAGRTRPARRGRSARGRAAAGQRLRQLVHALPAEAPQLMALKRRGVPIDGIAIRDRPEDVAALPRRPGAIRSSAIGADTDRRVQIALGSAGVPETFVVDGRGVIRHQHIGAIRPERHGRRSSRLRGGAMRSAACDRVALARSLLARRAPAVSRRIRCCRRPICQHPAPRPAPGGAGQGADGDAALPRLPGPVDRRQRRRDGRRHARAGPRSASQAGEKPEQIRAWLIYRYGDWVSYKPPLEPVTWPLWAAPLLLVAARRSGSPAAASGGGSSADGLARSCSCWRSPPGRGLWRFGRRDKRRAAVPRRALLLALAGYAWQGQPGLAGRPSAAAGAAAAARQRVRRRSARTCSAASTAPPHWLTMAEAYQRARRHAGAAPRSSAAASGAIRDDADLWVGSGNALVIHADGMMSPAAQLAFQRAAADRARASGAALLLRPRARPGRQVRRGAKRIWRAARSPTRRPTPNGGRWSRSGWRRSRRRAGDARRSALQPTPDASGESRPRLRPRLRTAGRAPRRPPGGGSCRRRR